MKNKRILIDTFPLAPLPMTKSDLKLMKKMTKEMKIDNNKKKFKTVNGKRICLNQDEDCIGNICNKCENK